MAEPIPYLDLKAQIKPLRAQIDAAIARTIDNCSFCLGPDTAQFEKDFAKFCGAEHAIGFNSGTSALHVAMLLLKVGPGDEVITTPFTFVATSWAISYVGAKPVFVDIDDATMNLDPNLVERAITPKTKAVMPVHLYGQPFDVDEVLEICRKHKLPMVEDAAQSHGAKYKGKTIGTFGELSGFSFYPGKNLGAFGDGGAVVTRNPALAEKVSLLRNYGQKVKYAHSLKGFNSRLDTMQAAVLRVKLKHLARWNDQRRAAAARYGQLLAGTELRLPRVAPWASPVWHLYVVQSNNRAPLQQALDAANISHGMHYPIPIHLQEAYQELGHGPGSFPVTESQAARIVSLPIFPEITEEELQRVAVACKGTADQKSTPVG